MSTPSPRRWLITGVARGFGRAFAEAALAAGDHVVGTVREAAQAAAFEALAPGRAHGRVFDVRDTAAAAPLVAAIERELGAIDVLVNNAGYGHEGLIEESTLADLRQQFEINVYGPVALMQAVLPYLRGRRAGHIINITSMGGLTTFPGLGYYHGSKFALEGLSEALGKEVAPLGIKVTAVEPGSFRTDWSGASMVRAGRSIADYDESFNPQRARRQANSGRQPGDPARAAQALLQLVAMPEPPAHLVLGSDALRLVGEKLDRLRAEMTAWDALSRSTDFP